MEVRYRSPTLQYAVAMWHRMCSEFCTIGSDMVVARCGVYVSGCASIVSQRRRVRDEGRTSKTQ